MFELRMNLAAIVTCSLIVTIAAAWLISVVQFMLKPRLPDKPEDDDGVSKE